MNYLSALKFKLNLFLAEKFGDDYQKFIAYLYKAKLAHNQNKSEQALKLLDQAFKIFETNSNLISNDLVEIATYLKSKILISNNQNKLALNFLDKVLYKKPNSYTANAMKAEVLGKLGFYQESIRILQRTKNLVPDNDKPLFDNIIYQIASKKIKFNISTPKLLAAIFITALTVTGGILGSVFLASSFALIIPAVLLLETIALNALNSKFTRRHEKDILEATYNPAAPSLDKYISFNFVKKIELEKVNDNLKTSNKIEI